MSRLERRQFLAAAGVLLAAPLAARARPSKRIYRVGYLSLGSSKPGPAGGLRMAFVDALRARGYVEGDNLVIEWRGAQGRPERLPTLAAELVKDRVDVIVSTSDGTHIAAKRVTSSIPIVMLISQDPVGRGLVASLARPGGNITGLSTVLLDLDAKQLESLRSILPHASKLAFLVDATGELPESVFQALMRRQASDSRALGFTVYPFAVRSLSGLDAVFAAIAREHMDALRIELSAFTFRNRSRILELALHAHLPTLVASRTFAEAGGLLSYGVDLRAAWRRGAYYVDRILKGARPGDLPIEQPTKFNLIINLKTAKALGTAVPQSVLLRADEVIK